MMQADQRKRHPRPSHGEAPFDVREVFYSRTDPRGVIKAGNHVFSRVAALGWEKLVGAPHRIIRHPDMPRGVFRLLWDRIQAGKPTGAYVKNLASDGLHYWVFALVTPIDGGYLSVRIKPTSPIFSAATALYKELLAAESGGLDPVASAAEILARMPGLGFADYDTFMAAALAAELTSPERTCVVPADSEIELVSTIFTALGSMLKEKGLLLRSFKEIHDVPMNLHIVASRIEAYGGPVATLAENYRIMAAEITQALGTLVGGAGAGSGLVEQMMAVVAQAQFRLGAVQIQHEISNAFRREDDFPTDVDRVAEQDFLVRLGDRFHREAREELGEVGRVSSRLMAACDDLRRLMLGLDSIRVLCRVEAGRMQVNSNALDSIIVQLEKFHDTINSGIARILDLASGIRDSSAAAMDVGRVAA